MDKYYKYFLMEFLGQSIILLTFFFLIYFLIYIFVYKFSIITLVCFSTGLLLERIISYFKTKKVRIAELKVSDVFHKIRK